MTIQAVMGHGALATTEPLPARPARRRAGRRVHAGVPAARRRGSPPHPVPHGRSVSRGAEPRPHITGPTLVKYRLNIAGNFLEDSLRGHLRMRRLQQVSGAGSSTGHVARGKHAEELYEEIEAASQSGFPRDPSLVALSNIDPQTLWKSLDDEENCQNLHDWAHDAGLHDVGERFKDAALQRPCIDDGLIPADIRALVMKRDGGHCIVCGATEDLTIDHKITPWSLGGSSKDPANLQVLCRSCNSSKGARPWVAPEPHD